MPIGALDANFFSTHVPFQESGSGFGLGSMLGFGLGLWFGLGVRVKGLGLGLGTFWTGLVLALGTFLTGTSVFEYLGPEQARKKNSHPGHCHDFF